MTVDAPAPDPAALQRALDAAQHLATEDHQAGLVRILEVQTEARRHGLVALQVRALIAEAHAALGRRPAPAVLALLERARAVADADGDAVSQGLACRATARVYSDLERPDLALQWARSACAAEPGFASLGFSALQASLLSQCGHLDEADAAYARLAPEAETDAATPAALQVQGLLLNNLAWQDLRCGRHAQGLQRSLAAEDRLRRSGDLRGLGDLQACRARLLAALGRGPEAEALCRAVLAETERPSPWTARLWHELAQLLQHDGRPDEALAAAETALGQALLLGLPTLAGFCRTLATLADARGDADRAREMRQRAADSERAIAPR